jgi:hypothetical protein
LPLSILNSKVEASSPFSIAQESWSQACAEHIPPSLLWTFGQETAMLSWYHSSFLTPVNVSRCAQLSSWCRIPFITTCTSVRMWTFVVSIDTFTHTHTHMYVGGPSKPLSKGHIIQTLCLRCAPWSFNTLIIKLCADHVNKMSVLLWHRHRARYTPEKIAALLMELKHVHWLERGYISLLVCAACFPDHVWHSRTQK